MVGQKTGSFARAEDFRQVSGARSHRHGPVGPPWGSRFLQSAARERPLYIRTRRSRGNFLTRGWPVVAGRVTSARHCERRRCGPKQSASPRTSLVHRIAAFRGWRLAGSPRPNAACRDWTKRSPAPGLNLELTEAEHYSSSQCFLARAEPEVLRPIALEGVAGGGRSVEAARWEDRANLQALAPLPGWKLAREVMRRSRPLTDQRGSARDEEGRLLELDD